MAEFDTGRVLFENEDHKVIWLGWDEDEGGGAVQTNQYLVINNGKGVLIDPGGVHLFSRVVAVISNYIHLDNIESIFFSHQDPDVSSGIALWLGITKADIHISELWIRFMPHFGIIDERRMKAIPDKGGSIKMGSGSMVLEAVPAHFLHSPGNFVAYDPVSRFLFSSDIGAAVFEKEKYLFVEDFNAHLQIMEGFHKRYMTSNGACKQLLHMLKGKPVNVIAPQHGALFAQEHVDEFFKWFETLKCGVDIIDQIEA